MCRTYCNFGRTVEVGDQRSWIDAVRTCRQTTRFTMGVGAPTENAAVRQQCAGIVAAGRKTRDTKQPESLGGCAD